MSLTRATLLFCAVSICGLAADPPTVSTSDVMDDQGHAFTVTNTSAIPLTGMIVKSDRRPLYASQDVHHRYFYDTFLNLNQKPLETGQSYTFHVGTDTGELHPMQISVEAAIFSNGTALGEDAAIKSLWQRRTWLVFEFREVLNLIDQGAVDINDRAALIKGVAQFKEMRFKTKEPIEEQEAIIVAYDTVLDSVRTDNVNLPKTIIDGIRQRETQRKAAIESQLMPLQARP